MNSFTTYLLYNFNEVIKSENLKIHSILLLNCECLNHTHIIRIHVYLHINVS